MGRLEHKVALVTGGARGIGRGISLCLAEAGADVALADVDLAGAERTAAEVRARGRRALALRLDVADAEAAREAVEAAIAALSRLDILVNNAGVVQDHVGAEATEADFDRCYAVNSKGIWHVSSAVAPHFRARGSGKIVNIASIAARRGVDALAAYAASKAAALSLTQSLAAALGPAGINVNAVCPGLLWTPMWEKIEGMFRRDDAADVVSQRAAFEAYLRQSCPLRREQTPEDVGHAVVFLASEEARNITGQALNVDGGIFMN
jgi:NAD(P)-dependent dehydrogenase (short-subunit alcohol dehydrogenase family)